MRFSLRATAAVAMLASAACQAGAGNASLETEDQKASYGIGINVGNNLAPAADLLDMAAFRRGLEDAMAGNESAVPEEEIQAALNGFNAKVRAAMDAEREEAAARNLAEGEAYLTENADRDGVQVTATGLQYEVLREGDGTRPGPTDAVTLHYRGTLIDGTEFDSSYGRNQPATFNVNGVIPGFSEGLQLMDVGSQYKFFIPGELGYGPQGSGPVIGPNATLIFEVELLEIQ